MRGDGNESTDARSQGGEGGSSGGSGGGGSDGAGAAMTTAGVGNDGRVDAESAEEKAAEGEIALPAAPASCGGGDNTAPPPLTQSAAAVGGDGSGGGGGGGDGLDETYLGSMLFTRNVSGTRVVKPG